jgi:hypothetical protein
VNALHKAGVNNIQIVGTRRSKIDLHIDDFLLEGEQDGAVRRAWCYVDQRAESIRWVDKNANGTWPQEVSERSLW